MLNVIFTREESQIASSPRHEMEVHVKVGAMKDGTIRAIDMYTPVSYTHLEKPTITTEEILL